MLDQSMHKSAVSLGVGVGDMKGKGAIIEVLVNNPGPTFNNGGEIVLSTAVSTVGITLVGATGP